VVHSAIVEECEYFVSLAVPSHGHGHCVCSILRHIKAIIGFGKKTCAL